ncbi:MAG: ATP-binding protein, partial [Caldimonas sp.]
EADEYLRALHPDDRHLMHRFHELADRCDSFPAEYRIVRPDGAVIWLAGRGLVIARGVDGSAQRLVNIMADVTERRQAEEELRVERERLSLALSAGQMGAFDLNIRTDSLWWSPQTYTLFGVDPQTFQPTRTTVSALIDPEDLEEFLRRRDVAIDRRQALSHELRIRRPDGVTAWIAYQSRTDYAEDGHPARSFGIIMDITDRRQAEQLLREADRRKDDFIATLAHELRNPLAPIRNAVNVLRHAKRADQHLAWCRDVIDRQVGQMARLLDDLLDVSRMTRGKFRLRRESLDLETVLEQGIETARPFIDAARHTLQVDAPTHRIEFKGDLTRLAQVVANLLINAAKYTPPEGRIALSVKSNLKEISLTVSDTGIGIAAEQIPEIFKMFGQVESAIDRSQGGLGIGLALAKGLVEMHGGQISASSEGIGHGSQFHIRLPIDQMLRGHEPMRTEPSAGSIGTVPRRILVADDLRDNADSLATLLESMGHSVHVAYDGAQALAMAHDIKPDVVLLDLGMPMLNGFDACREIRRSPWGQEVILIAQTGWGQEEDRRRTREAGFDHHVLKPIDPAALVELLNRRP